MKAAERIAYYAEQFPIVEMETSYRFPPSAAASEQWAERTPAGFTFDIPAWSLLVGQATFPPSLHEDLVKEIRSDRRDRERIYSSHLSNDALDECWRRFHHALRPLVDTGKLGTIILKIPRWQKPGASGHKRIEELRSRLGDLPAAIELSNPAWVEAESCESTFSLLEDLDMSFVCVDAGDDHPRSLGQAEATTSRIAVLRLLGRRTRNEAEGWQQDWRSYRYEENDFDEVLPRIRHLAEGCEELHVLFSTCWRDDAVSNAHELLRRVSQAQNENVALQDI